MSNLIYRCSALLMLLACTLAACQPQSPSAAPAATASPATPAVVGGDRDVYGCIGSAGYAWCARAKACTRPWELARQEGFDNTTEAFQAYCSGH